MPLTAHQTETATILVVDDTTDNLVLMVELFAELYTIKVANCGERALYIARKRNCTGAQTTIPVLKKSIYSTAILLF